ncbi:MAG: DUF58 domain-containing protein [Cyclobacteriaceae bacterium]
MLISYLDIDPHELDELETFQWYIKTIAQGFRTGKKISRKLGAGMEFSQYRPYSQGDDLRRLDWKMYARSDRYYIKESEIETQLEVTFVLDTSRSMAYEESGRSKFKFAKLLIGILSYLSLQEGDSIGLAAAGYQLSGQDEKAWRRFMFELMERKETPDFQPPAIVNKHRKELFVVLTDHYEESSDIPHFVEELKTSRNEVIVLHLMGNRERTLDFKAGDRFQDLENNQIVAFEAAKKKEYDERVSLWMDNLQQQYLSQAIDYIRLDFSTPLTSVIRSINNHRKNLL